MSTTTTTSPSSCGKGSKSVTKSNYPRTPHSKIATTTTANNTRAGTSGSVTSKRSLQLDLSANSSDELQLEELYGNEELNDANDGDNDSLTYISESDDANMVLSGSKLKHRQKRTKKAKISDCEVIVDSKVETKKEETLLQKKTKKGLVVDPSEPNDCINVQPVKYVADVINNEQETSTFSPTKAADTTMSSSTLKDTSLVAPLPIMQIHLKQICQEDYQSLCNYPRYLITKEDLISMLKQYQKSGQDGEGLMKSSSGSSGLSPSKKRFKEFDSFDSGMTTLSKSSLCVTDVKPREASLWIYVAKHEMGDFFPFHLKQATVRELKHCLIISGLLNTSTPNASTSTTEESPPSMILFNEIAQLFLVGRCGIRVVATDELIRHQFITKDIFFCFEVIPTGNDGHVCSVVLKRTRTDY